MADVELIAGVSAAGRGLVLAAPVVVSVVIETPVVRAGMRRRRKGLALRVCVAMNVASALALVWLAPWIGEAWRAIPGFIENPVHRWYARGKLSPWEGAFVVAVASMISTLVEWGVLSLCVRLRRPRALMAGLIGTNAVTAFIALWWAGVRVPW
jgi:hypothetical protein